MRCGTFLRLGYQAPESQKSRLKNRNVTSFRSGGADSYRLVHRLDKRVFEFTEVIPVDGTIDSSHAEWVVTNLSQLPSTGIGKRAIHCKVAQEVRSSVQLVKFLDSVTVFFAGELTGLDSLDIAGER